MKVWQHEPPELLRFFVESRSGGEPHLVDLFDWRCSCPDWQFRVQPDPHNEPPCPHLEAAMREWALQTLGDIRRLTTVYHGP